MTERNDSVHAWQCADCGYIYGGSMDHVIRYVPTYVNRDGMRTLMTAAQGRHTYATAEDAQAWLDAVFNTAPNSPDTLKQIWGENPRCEVRPCKCWPGHFDPISIYFEMENE